VEYIHNNPVRAGIVNKAEDYIYSSAINYKTENRNGIMEVDLLETWWSNVGKI